jgi:hypothetical protein
MTFQDESCPCISKSLSIWESKKAVLLLGRFPCGEQSGISLSENWESTIELKAKFKCGLELKDVPIGEVTETRSSDTEDLRNDRQDFNYFVSKSCYIMISANLTS